MIYFSDFGVAAPGPGNFAVTQVPLRATTGTQDITITGFGTPKAVRIVVNAMVPGGSDGSGCRGSMGASDGTNQYAAAWATNDGATRVNNVRSRAATDAILMMLEASSGNVLIEAAFDSFITDGVRINVTTTDGTQVAVMVEMFTGASLTAHVGTSALAIQNGTSTITPGFQINALFVDSAQTPFTDTQLGGAYCISGVASYDGSTTRQVGQMYRSDSLSPSSTTGVVRDNAVFTFDTGRYAEITSITSTQVVLTTRGGNLSTLAFGYLALNFGGAHAAWAGIIDTPTANGNHDFTGPSFTPSYVSLRPNTHPTVNTNQTGGLGGAFAINAISPLAEYSSFYRDRDGSSVATAKSIVTSTAVYVDTDSGGSAYRGTFVSFLSNGARINLSAQRGVVDKWPFLFIG